MRLLSIVLFLSAISAIRGFGAFGAATAWDVRTTGSDSNGGGFDSGVASPGTDFSQQDAAQIAYTDIIVGATTTQGTSVLNPFGATSPGNIVNITAGAGCTVQRAEIVSVSGTTATFDKSLGTAASTCTGNLGGSLLTVAQSLLLWVSQNTIYIKAGTYTITTALSWNTDTGSLTIQGFNSTHTDLGTKPLITTATNSVNIFSNTGSTASTIRFVNLSLSSTAGTRGGGIFSNVQSKLVVMNCILDGFRKGISGDVTDTNFFVEVGLTGTEIKNSTMAGFHNSGSLNLLQGSYIHDNAGGGVLTAAVNIDRSIISANTGTGITGSNCSLTGTTVANNTSDGLLASGPTDRLVNNIFYGNGGYGANLPASMVGVPFQNAYNAYGANTTAPRNNFSVGLNDITLTASPFVSSTNFALNATAGGGAALKQTGYPGIFPGATSTGYLDVGAVQTSGAPGTGGAYNAAFTQ